MRVYFFKFLILTMFIRLEMSLRDFTEKEIDSFEDER